MEKIMIRTKIDDTPKEDQEKQLSFEVSADPFYSDANMARLRSSIAQMESTGGTIHEIAQEEGKSSDQTC
ncbi:MAG TPA: hypothetical protein IAC37_10600 [Candidatus Ventrimonas merdavium]|nr:hypothetical protein [Candidatus Ventrimonas merdavium]